MRITKICITNYIELIKLLTNCLNTCILKVKLFAEEINKYNYEIVSYNDE